MEEELEPLKNFKITLPYYDEEGKKSSKQFTIKVSDPKDISEKALTTVVVKFKMQFSLEVPKHMYNFMVGKSVPFNSMSEREGVRKYTDESPKSLRAYTLERVCDMYNELCGDYRWLKQMEKADMKKVIFYQFDNKTSTVSTDYNSVKIGIKSVLNYAYFVGYINESPTGRDNRYNAEKRFINVSYDSGAYKYKYVTWSEEREAFFENINGTFERIISDINSFEEKISEDTIGQMIEGNVLKFLK